MFSVCGYGFIFLNSIKGFLFGMYFLGGDLNSPFIYHLKRISVEFLLSGDRVGFCVLEGN